MTSSEVSSPTSSDEMVALQQRVAELEQRVVERDRLYSCLSVTLRRSPHILWTIDATGRPLAVEGNAIELTGYARDQLLQAGRHIPLDRVHPDDVDKVSQAYASLLAGAEHLSIEYRYETPDGDLLWLYDEASTIEGAEDTRHIGGLTKDITANQTTARALLAAAHEWRTTFDAIGDTMCLLDAEGRIVRCNEAMTRLVGKSFAEILGCHYRELFESDGGDQAPSLFQGARISRKRGQREQHFRDRWLSVTMDPMMDDGGDFVGAVFLASDITERVARDRALRLYTDRLRILREIDGGILAAQSSRATAQAAVQGVRRLIPCLGAGVILWDEEANEVELLTSASEPAISLPDGTRVSLEYSHGAIAQLQKGHHVILTDLEQCGPQGAMLQEHGVHALVFMPLMAQSKLIGSLVLSVADPSQVNETHLTTVGQVADQLAIAIRQAQLDEQVHRHAADLEETVAERTREILALRERAEQAAVIEERQRLARELHDAVTQCLYSATLLSETGHQAAMENDLDVARGCLARLIDISQQALKEMRLLIYELRPEALESVGLLGAIERRLDAVESRAGIESHLVADGRPPLTILQEEAAYRIVIEALNNALKHANAACVTVCIQSGEGQTHISIADNGKGFVPERAAIAGGMGLNSMKERAERLGGRLDILSVLGQGTTVTLGVPSHEPTAPPDHAKPGATV